MSGIQTRHSGNKPCLPLALPSGDKDTPSGDEDTPSGDEDTPCGDEDTPCGDEDTPSGDEDTWQASTLPRVHLRYPPPGMRTYPAGIFDLRASVTWRVQACVFLFFFFQAALTFFFSNHFFCFYIIRMLFLPSLWSKPYTKILLLPVTRGGSTGFRRI